MTHRDKAQNGLRLLKEAVLGLLRDNPSGLGNAEIADLLGIRSSFGKGAKDWFSWSLLGMLWNEKRIVRKGRRYLLNGSAY